MTAGLGRSAVFLDRDGTVVQDRGYIIELDQVLILEGVVEGMRLLRDRGFILIMASNQSGVARGYFGLARVREANEYILRLLAAGGAAFDGVYFCPHHPDGIVPEYSIRCECRKPRIGMAREAASDFGLALGDCYVVGDQRSDLEFGRGFGASGVVHVAGARDCGELIHAPDCRAANLLDAARWIIGDRARKEHGQIDASGH
jgi:D-glycero-D-manno-heptose 1,7-bisphosphate phosphatase